MQGRIELNAFWAGYIAQTVILIAMIIGYGSVLRRKQMLPGWLHGLIVGLIAYGLTYVPFVQVPLMVLAQGTAWLMRIATGVLPISLAKTVSYYGNEPATRYSLILLSMMLGLMLMSAHRGWRIAGIIVAVIIALSGLAFFVIASMG